MAGKQARLEALIEPVTNSLGCQLWGVEYFQSGQRSVLRVYIDRAAEGVSVEDCESVSRQLGAVLDVEDPITGEYTLEVSSPGMDRRLFKLQHYAEWAGATVKVQLKSSFDGRKSYRGLLKGVEGTEVILEVEEQELVLPIESIEKARVIPTWGTK